MIVMFHVIRNELIEAIMDVFVLVSLKHISNSQCSTTGVTSIEM